MLSDVCEDRNNGFNFLRILAATGILTAHCLLVIPIEDNISTQADKDIRFMIDLLLAVFFVFSGFLITASIERNPNILRFAIARCLRIFPALIAVAFVLAFVLGPLATTESLWEYFLSADTWRFVPSLSILLNQAAALPGLFSENPVAHSVDMPIWTLRYEVAIYAAFPFLYLTFFAENDRWRTGSVILMFIVYLASQAVPSLKLPFEALENLAHFSVSFLIGATFWMYRRWVPNSAILVVILWLVFVLNFHGTFAMITGVFAAGYTFIWIAFCRLPGLQAYNKFGDYSYGIYIIHFPVGQLFYQLNPAVTPTMLLYQTFTATLLLAIVLWTFVEKPALSKVKAVEAQCAGLLDDMIYRFSHRSRRP